MISAIMLGYIGLFLINAFWPDAYLQGAMGLAALLIFLLTFSLARPPTRYVSILLIAVGVYMLIVYEASSASWVKASIYNSSIISLVLTVPLLGTILYFEPYQKYLSTIVLRFVKSPYQFYAISSLLVAFLSSLMNLASFHFVYQLLHPLSLRYPSRLFNSALVRGFLPNMIWSPSYIAVAIAAQYSRLSWFEVAPVGLAIAAVGIVTILLLGWIEFGRLKTVPAEPISSEPHESIVEATRSLLKLGLQIAVLISLIVVIEYLTHKSALVIVPLVSLTGPLFLALIYGKTEAFATQSREFITQKLPRMNNEMILFSAIGFFGHSLAISDIPGYIPVFINHMGLDTAATLVPLIIFSIGLLSLVGLHPMITIAALAAALPPGSIPLSPRQLAGTFLTGYMFYTAISPFSAVNLFMGSLSKQTHFMIGPQQNGLFSLIYTLLAIGVLLAFF